MNQQQWLEWRRSGIGASDAPTIMGVSPYKTLNQLWKEKLLGETVEDNAAMARGREIEPVALDWFMGETGILLDTQRRYEHPQINWMRATVDGINEDEKILLEIKSCRNLHEEVPKHYYPQLQHQMEVLGYEWMYYVSHDGNEGKILKVDKDPSYVETLVEKEKEFWEKVQAGAKDMEISPDWEDISNRLREIRKMKEDIKEEEGFLLSQAILFSDGVPAYGKGMVLQKKVRKGSVEYKKIPALQSLDLSEYRKPDVEYWDLSLQK